MTKTTDERQEKPLAADTARILHTPNEVFADQFAQLIVGPFVSRITFGVDSTVGEPPIPVQTVVIPTPALVHLAHQVLELIAQEGVTSNIHSQLTAFMSSLSSPKQG